MALIWADGFDHWGNTANAELGGYDDFHDGAAITSSNPRTGGYCASIKSGGTGDDCYFQKTLDVAVSFIIAQAAFYFASSYNQSSTGFGFYSVSGAQMSVHFNASNGIDIKDGTTTVVASSANNIVTPGQYTSLAVKYDVDAVTGSIEVQVNGVTVVTFTGDTDPQGDGNISYIRNGRNRSASTTPATYIDDLIYLDSGDFIGDRRCFTSFATSDGATQDWSLSSGSDGFDLIDSVPPNEAGYIQGDAVSDVSTFQKDALPGSVSSITGVNVFAYGLKTDAGVSSIQIGIDSNGSVEQSAGITMGEGGAFYNTIIEDDPDTGSPFTKSGYDAALMRVNRSA